MEDIDPQLTISEAARLLDVSIDTIRRWESAGKISATRTGGGQRRFSVAAVQALMVAKSA